MDNKDNRTFYWEVKDFLNKKPQTFEQKKSSLKDSIVGILNENNLLRNSSFSNDTHMTQDVSKYLRALSGEEKKYDPGHPSYAKNSTVNPFTLNEYAAPKEPLPTWKERNPEQYAANVKERQEKEDARKANLDASIKNKKAEQAAMPDREGTEREARAANIAKTIETLSGKDPSSLTAKEAAELQMAKIYTKGGSLSKGDSKLEGRIRANIDTSKLNVDNSPKVQALQGPTETGGNAADNAAINTAMERTLGRSTEDLANTTQNAVGREMEIKKQEDAAVADKIKQDRYEKMQGQRIQGTNMTYGDYKSKFGKDYNAFDKGESSMLNKVAGAGRYGSEAARQGAVSSYQFNQAYDKQNTAMAQKGGELTRQVDQSQMELDRFRNMTTAKRQAAARQEISNIQSQSGFMARPAAQQPNYGGIGSPKYGQAPSLISRPGQTPPGLIRRR